MLDYLKQNVFLYRGGEVMVARYCKTFFVGGLICAIGIFLIGAKETSMNDSERIVLNAPKFD